MYVMDKHTSVPKGLQRFSPIYYEKNGERRFVCNMEGWSLSSCALGSISSCHEFRFTEVEEFWAFLKTCSWNSGYKIRNFTMLLKDGGPTREPSPALLFARKYGTVLKEFKNKSHHSDGILQLFFFDLDEH